MIAYGALTTYGTLIVGLVVLAACAYDLAADLMDRASVNDGTDGTPGSGERAPGGRP